MGVHNEIYLSGCHDEPVWASKSEEQRQRIMNECFDDDDELRRGGHVVGGEALDSAHNTVTVPMKDGAVAGKDWPYAEGPRGVSGNRDECENRRVSNQSPSDVVREFADAVSFTS